MRLLNSLSFRLALIYVGLFTASVAALGGLYYWVAIASPLQSVREQLETESSDLAGQYRSGGADRVAVLLEQRAGAPSPRLAYHALLRSDGTVVTSNLPSWPRASAERWLRIEADVSREGGEDEYEALVRDEALSDGGRLMIGRDIDDLDDLEEELVDALGWLVPALALLGILGAGLMSQAIGARLETMSSAARRVIAGDLSERIPLRGTGDDFDRLGDTLNLMLARIEESIEAVRRVSDNVAHELRTPLARLQASLVELQSVHGEEDRRIAEVIAEAQRLQSIFEAVLRIARVESSLHSENFESLDAAVLLVDAAEYYQPQAEESGQMLSVEASPGLWVTGDRHLLFQAISNLIDNAIKYTPAGGRISVSAEAVGKEVVIVVADDGPGLAAGLQARLGERFFRAPVSLEKPGLGLGLTFVSAVAAMHGSVVSFPAVERGFKAEWRLPAEAAPASGR